MKPVHYLVIFTFTVVVSIFAPALIRMTQNVFNTWRVVSPNAQNELVSTIITPDQLAKYTGLAGSPGMYLSILGKVYDVKGGEKHYGSGSAYNFFVGK